MKQSRLYGVTPPEAALAEEVGSPLLSIDYDEDGKIIDFLNNRVHLEDKKEERRRQEYLKILHYEYGYPKEQMRREVAINIGSSVPIYADIVVYRDIDAAKNKP